MHLKLLQSYIYWPVSQINKQKKKILFNNRKMTSKSPVKTLRACMRLNLLRQLVHVEYPLLSGETSKEI